MAKHHSNLLVRGEVVGATKFDFKTKGNGKINITVSANGLTLTTQLFFFKNKVKLNKEEMSISAFLKKIVDGDGRGIGTRIFGFGEYFENRYTNKEGKTNIYNEARLYSVFIVGDDEEYLSFNTKGIVESVTSIDEDTRLRIGVIDKQWNRDLKKEVPAIKYLNVTISKDYLNSIGETSAYTAEEIVEGTEVELGGSIVYGSSAKIDQFGRRKGEGVKKGNYVVIIDDINEYPDLEEYEKIKNGRLEEPEKPKDDDIADDDFDLEDDDFSDEDIPF